MIDGFDELSKMLKEAQDFAGEVDGVLVQLNFNPFDPSSIETAIQTLNARVDEKASRYPRNDFIAEIAEGLKEEGRNSILERAAEARLSAEDQK